MFYYSYSKATLFITIKMYLTHGSTLSFILFTFLSCLQFWFLSWQIYI